MKKSSLLSGLRIAMQALAERRGITLQIGGNTAFTNGRAIVIPELPEDDQEASILARGYIDHEAAHIKLTNFTIVPAPNQMQWTNILEDVRIEREQGEKYPGVAINTRELVELLVRQGNFTAPEDDPTAQLMLWTLSRCRARVLRQTALSGKEAACEKYCRVTFGNPFCDKFLSIVDKVKACKSTEDCMVLVEEIMLLLKKPPLPRPVKKPKPKNAKTKLKDKGTGDSSQSDTYRNDESGDKGKMSDLEDEGKDGNNLSESKSKSKLDYDKDEDDDKEDASGGKSSSDKDKTEENGKDGGGPQTDDFVLANGDDRVDGQGGSSASDTGSQSGIDKERDSGNDTDSKGSNGEGNTPVDSQSGQSGTYDDDCGSGGDGASNTRRQQQIQNLRTLKSAETEFSPDLGEMLEAALNQKGKVMEDSGEPVTLPTVRNQQQSETGLEEFKKMLSNARRKTSKMRTQLTGLFQAIGLQHAYPTQVGYRLDGRSTHLVAANTPDTRVFATRREKQTENTAITLLVDVSGSMHRDIDLAIQAAFVTSDTLESMSGVTCCTAVFTRTDMNGVNGILPIKKFGVKPMPKDFYIIHADGGTPIAGTVLWAGQQLALRREERKIIVLFTDGEPDDSLHAEKAVKKVNRYGIEVYAVAMNKTSIHTAMKDASKWIDVEKVTPISKIEELGPSLLKLLRRALVRKKMGA